MASTTKRWMNPFGVCIGTSGASCTSLNDVVSIDVTASASFIGSNSEDDLYANHFLQGVQRAQRATLRTYDIPGAVAMFGDIGKVKKFMAFRLPAASEAGTSTDIRFYTAVSATSGGGVGIESIDIPGEHDAEAVATISLIFRTNGQRFSLASSTY